MTEQELRSLVRQVIARVGQDRAPSPLPSVRDHSSQATFVLPDGSDADGPCIIEPSVPCNHCGYCKSLGH